MEKRKFKILNIIIQSLKSRKMNPTKKQARMAGLLYFLMGLTGVFGLMYVPLKINVAGDTIATLNNIIHSEFLFRAGILSRILCQIIFIFLVLALSRLFLEVNKLHTRAMVALVLVSVPIAILFELNQVAALVLLNGADFLSGFNTEQLNALALIFLKLYEQGIFIVEIFWGLWLFPFGYLAYKSGFIPKIIGILLIVACIGYLVESLVNLLFPFGGDLISKLIPFVTIGEIVMMFWLLIVGVKKSYTAPVETEKLS